MDELNRFSLSNKLEIYSIDVMVDYFYKLKGDVNFQLALKVAKDTNVKHFKIALESYMKAVDLYDKMKGSFESSSSKLFLSSKENDYYKK